ncbi:MAG: type VI secretion system tube protein Hcp [Pseudomonadota bacterium]
MSFDAFMYFPKDNSDVAGETNDDAMSDSKYKAFELISFEFGAENNINIGSISGGGGAGKATFKEFNITKKTDTASCGLFNALCTGQHFGEGIIELRRSGGGSGVSGEWFLKFHFLMVMVQDISWSGSDGDDVCEEAVIFQYGAMKIEYRKQKSDGSHEKKLGFQGEAVWSRVKNKATYAC